jgi:hypothetical protein
MNAILLIISTGIAQSVLAQGQTALPMTSLLATFAKLQAANALPACYSTCMPSNVDISTICANSATSYATMSGCLSKLCSASDLQLFTTQIPNQQAFAAACKAPPSSSPSATTTLKVGTASSVPCTSGTTKATSIAPTYVASSAAPPAPVYSPPAPFISSQAPPTPSYVASTPAKPTAPCAETTTPAYTEPFVSSPAAPIPTYAADGKSSTGNIIPTYAADVASTVASNNIVVSGAAGTGRVFMGFVGFMMSLVVFYI